MLRIWFYILKRDLLLAFRLRAEAVYPLLFFVLVVTLFPLGIGDNKKLLMEIAPGIIWVTALLAAMLSLDSMFRSDYEDGSLEQLTLSSYPLAVIVSAKIMAHWLVSGLPLLLVAPLLGVLLYLPDQAMPILLLTLLLGTPVLSLVGAIGIALTVGLRRGGVVLSLLILPLYVPVLIFSTLAIQNAVEGFSAVAQISMLAALLVLAVTLTPMAVASALRISLD